MTSANDFSYVAPYTLAQFMRSNKRVRIVRGPIGSGKSTAMAVELFRRAIEQEPGKDGIRRTQMAVVRNTGVQLRQTCLPTILQLFGKLAQWKPSTGEIIFRFGDVHSNWLLLPLDTPDNVRRLLSLELTMAWCSELREIPPEIVKDVYSRCGRFPSKMYGGPSFYGLVGETNSFSEDSEWNAKLEDDLPENWDYFIQPPGVTEVTAENLHLFPGYGISDVVSTGENVENLTATYYTDQIISNGGIKSPWCRQYIMNEIAPSVAGEAVFKQSFVQEFHVSEELLHPEAGSPLCIGMDTGRNPAAVITQVDSHGRKLVLGECYGSNMGMEMFINTILRPYLSNDRFSSLPMYVVVDPAGMQRSQVGEESVLQAVNRLGFSAVTAQTNDIAPRLRSVEKWLQQQRFGAGAILFCKQSCPTLVLSMSSRYRYKKKKDGSLEENTPDKNHPYSDLADSLQYACLGSATAVRAQALRKISPRPRDAREPAMGGWT